MKSVFSSYFASDEQRREKLWQDCIFVFDTNVYTGVYKRSDDARDAFYKVAESLGERLWAPYQVIYEYLDNRAKITHEQSKLYAAAIDELESILKGYESVNKHPFLTAGTYSEFQAVSDKVLLELEERRQFHEGRINDDDIRDKLLVLLDGKVGDKYSVEELGAIIKEGEKRYSNLDAPGFEDAGKHKGSTVFDHVCKRYGDLIIWKQVLDKAKASGKPVIMVTEEQKEDWWAKMGGKTIGPLPELIEEFNLVTGQDFYLYSYHSFLSLANGYLDQDTSPAVIAEVRDAPSQATTEWLYELESSSGTDDFFSNREEVLLAPELHDEWGDFLSTIEFDEEFLVDIDGALRRRLIKYENDLNFHILHRRKLANSRTPENALKSSKYRAMIASDSEKIRIIKEKMLILRQKMEELVSR